MHDVHLHPRHKSGAIGIAAALFVAGCAVGPDYRVPALTLDAGFVNAGSTSNNAQAPAADIARFWNAFGDAALSQLVASALAANGNVRIAQAR